MTQRAMLSQSWLGSSIDWGKCSLLVMAGLTYCSINKYIYTIQGLGKSMVRWWEVTRAVSRETLCLDQGAGSWGW